MPLHSGRFTQNKRLQQAAENNPSMKQGEKGDAVAIVQQALVDLGFSMPITTHHGGSLADGIFGHETTGVVKQFQTANGLAVDGIVGRKTLAKLDELIIAQASAKEVETRIFARRDFTLKTAKPEA